MTQSRVSKVVHEVKNYYFSLEELAHNMEVPEKWILQNLIHLPDRKRFNDTWYFSPDDYHKLKELRDEIYPPAVG